MVASWIKKFYLFHGFLEKKSRFLDLLTSANIFDAEQKSSI